MNYYFQDIPKVEIIKAASNGDVQDKDISEDDGLIPKYVIFAISIHCLKNILNFSELVDTFLPKITNLGIRNTNALWLYSLLGLVCQSK